MSGARLTSSCLSHLGKDLTMAVFASSTVLVFATRPNGVVGSRLSVGPSRGTTADGFVMDYWDRPLDEAVDLMNEWLARYKAA